MLQKLLHAQKKKKMKRDNYENIIIGLIQFSESWIFLKSKSKYSDAYLYEIKAYETKRGEKERERERLDIFLSFGEHEVALQPRVLRPAIYIISRAETMKITLL